MSRRRGSAGFLLVVVLMAAALSGCGGDEESSSDASTWADGLCGSLVTWRDSVTSAASKVTEGDLSRDTLEETLADLSDANETLADDVDALGEPPMETADQAKTEVEELSDRLETEAGKIEDAVSDISGEGDLLGTVSVVSSAISTMADDLSATVSELRALGEDDEWQQAFEESDACQSLSNR